MILPDTLVEELQNYIQGGYIYILIKQRQQKSWGEVSGYKAEFKKRTSHISIFGCSMGAYFSLLAYKNEALEHALFLSPVVDMKKILILSC